MWLPAEAHATWVTLAADSGRPMSAIVADLIERERRRVFLEECGASFARLQADPVAWADYRAELKSMEGTLMDGLEDDPWVE